MAPNRKKSQTLRMTRVRSYAFFRLSVAPDHFPPNLMQPHEVRGARSESRSGHQAEHVPGTEKSFRQQFRQRASVSTRGGGTFVRPRGKSMALNSAPISTTSEIRYIQTSSAIPTPSEP